MLLMIPALFTSCSQPAEVIPGYEGVRLNPDFLSDIEDVKALNEAIYKGDREGMELYLHENFFALGPSADDYLTRQEFIDHIISTAEFIDDFKSTGDIYFSIICDEFEGRPELVGKWVYLWNITSFRQKGYDKVVEFPCHFAIRIRDGKVDHMSRYYDRLSRSEQLGFTLLPPAPAEE